MLSLAPAALDGSLKQYRDDEEYRKQQDDCCCQNNRPAERAGTIMTWRQCREGPQVQRGHGSSISQELQKKVFHNHLGQGPTDWL